LSVEGAKLFIKPSAVAWHLKGETGGARGHAPDIFLEDHRTFMAQRKSMRSGIHLNLGHGIGDGLMATPMIHMMRKANEGRNIAVFAPWAESVLTGNPDVDVVAVHPLDEQRTVRLEQSVYAWASAHGWKGHLAEAYCKMFELPMPEDTTPLLSFTREEETLRLPDAILDKPFMVISPWSTAQTFDLYQPSGNKNWPLDRWLPVVAWAHEMGLLVVQMRGSEEEPLIAGVDLDFCGQPLRAAFLLVKQSEIVVSVDTMTHHVAAALNVPAVVLWGRSTASHFGYDKKSILNIQGECPGIQISPHSREEPQSQASPQSVVQERPCVHGDQWAMDREVCPIAGHPCMSSITWEMVRAALEKLILFRKKPCSGGLNAA
jgi:ADP-heptose:LPS heptosyltransferase